MTQDIYLWNIRLFCDQVCESDQSVLLWLEATFDQEMKFGYKNYFTHFLVKSFQFKLNYTMTDFNTEFTY
jgi:hypothetical protein